MKTTITTIARRFTALILTLLALISLPSCSSKEEETLPPSISLGDPTEKPLESQKDTDKETIVETEPPVIEFEYKIDITEYLDAIIVDANERSKYLTLINKSNTVGADYVPESKVKIPTELSLYGKEIFLESRTEKAAEAMLAEMRANGFTKIYISSGYRSYEYQTSIFYTYYDAEKKANPGLSDEEIRAKVLTYSAYPGTSEHQSGLCMDLFVSPGMTELVNYGKETTATGDIGFAETEEFRWLLENAHKFGFILRFPEDKTNITGYSYESWHFRFVGREEATKIYQSGLCFEEYLDLN